MTIHKIRLDKPAIYTLVLIVLTLFCRLMIAAFTGLGVGESYYTRGAEYLQLSYFDQPPLFFWIGGLAMRLLGENTFALRFPSIVMFSGTTWFVYLIGKRLFNEWTGFFAAFLMNISFVFSVCVGCWFQPDAPLLFFWLACTYCIIQIVFPKENGNDVSTLRNNYKTYCWWILAGVMMGLASLSKYHVIFLLAGVLFFFLFNTEQRHWIWHPGPYIALFINCIFLLPVLIWNYQNDWISFAFQGARAESGGEFTLHFDWFFTSIAGQTMWLLPWIWGPLVWQVPRLCKTTQASAFCFWTALWPIVFFTSVALWSNPQGHFHWQAPGYMMLFLPLGAAVDSNLSTCGRLYKMTRVWLVTSTIVIFFITTLLAVHMTTGIWTFYGPKWAAQKFANKYDPTMDGIDYEDIRARFEQEGWMNKKNLFVGVTRWWLAGKVDWALRAQKELVVFHSDTRNYAFFSEPLKLQGYDAIVIAQDHAGTVAGMVTPFFKNIARLKDIEIVRSGIPELTLQVYYCTFFSLPLQPMEEMPLYRQLSSRKPFGNS